MVLALLPALSLTGCQSLADYLARASDPHNKCNYPVKCERGLDGKYNDKCLGTYVQSQSDTIGVCRALLGHKD